MDSDMESDMDSDFCFLTFWCSDLIVKFRGPHVPRKITSELLLKMNGVAQ